MNRRGQAAMEFLMTYGWAILIVLVAIGALAYFGVLSPDNFLPERCTGPAGLDCVDKASIDATTNNVSFVLRNNVGFTITNLAITDATFDCTMSTPTSYGILVENSSGQFNNATTAFNNRRILVYVVCTDFQQGRLRSDIQFSYQNSESGLSHKATVSVIGKAS